MSTGFFCITWDYVWSSCSQVAGHFRVEVPCLLLVLPTVSSLFQMYCAVVVNKCTWKSYWCKCFTVKVKKKKNEIIFKCAVKFYDVYSKWRHVFNLTTHCPSSNRPRSYFLFYKLALIDFNNLIRTIYFSGSAFIILQYHHPHLLAPIQEITHWNIVLFMKPCLRCICKGFLVRHYQYFPHTQLGVRKPRVLYNESFFLFLTCLWQRPQFHTRPSLDSFIWTRLRLSPHGGQFPFFFFYWICVQRKIEHHQIIVDCQELEEW